MESRDHTEALWVVDSIRAPIRPPPFHLLPRTGHRKGFASSDASSIPPTISLSLKISLQFHTHCSSTAMKALRYLTEHPYGL